VDANGTIHSDRRSADSSAHEDEYTNDHTEPDTHTNPDSHQHQNNHSNQDSNPDSKPSKYSKADGNPITFISLLQSKRVIYIINIGNIFQGLLYGT